MKAWHLGCLALATLAAGCAQQATRQKGIAVYSVDQRGQARMCDATRDTTIEPGKTAEVAFKMSNDGWCGVVVSQANDKPFAAGLVKQMPAHGKLYVHTVGDSTRVDYTPDRGYLGPDSYVVRLVPGDSMLNAVVTVATPGS